MVRRGKKGNTKYFFQHKKRSFTQRFFEKGANVAVYILFSLKESGKDLLRELPSSYPSFKIMKEVFGADSYRERSKVKKNIVRMNLWRLEKDGLIAKDPKKKIHILTEKGKEFTAYIEDRYSIMTKEWDKKLRLVIFDIPEEEKMWREWLRQELLLLQFKQLQKSVYVGKCPLPESLYKTISENNLNQYIFVLTAGEVDRMEEIDKILEK